MGGNIRPIILIGKGGPNICFAYVTKRGKSGPGCDVCSVVRLEIVFTVRFGGRRLDAPLSVWNAFYCKPRESMAATASAAPAESELDRSGVEDEPRSAEPEEYGGNGQAGPTAAAQQHRLAKLPLSRIKALMKADPDVSLASQESVFIIAKATVRYTHTNTCWIHRSPSLLLSRCLFRLISVMPISALAVFNYLSKLSVM